MVGRDHSMKLRGAIRLRDTMRRWPSGVTAVTAAFGPRRTGMTVSSFASLTLSPPTVLVCLHKATETLRLLSGSGVFGISILNQDQEHVSRQLAAPPDNGPVGRLAGISIRMGRSGAPLIQGACAWMECRVVRLIRLSTHVVVIGEVRACGQRRGAPGPLLYHDRRYRQLR